MGGIGILSAATMAETLVEVLQQQAACQPDKRAFLLLDNGERETQSLTYGELERQSRMLAGDLVRLGLRGQRAVLAYPTCLDFVVAVFACFHAGIVAVPAPLALRGSAFSRVRGIVADSQAAAILSLSALIEEGSERPEFLAVGAGSAPQMIATDRIGKADPLESPVDDPLGLALLQYTSGSTGDPRGVMLTHANLIHNQRVLARVLKAGPDDSAVCWLPLYHDMGLIGAVLHSVFVGGFCVLMPPLSFLQRPMRWLKAMSRYRATISMAPCFAYDLCAQRMASQPTELDLSHWRAAICGGEPVRPPVFERFSENFRGAGFDPAALLPSYGLAEATLLATAPAVGTGAMALALGTPESPKRFIACGKPWEEHRVAIVDPSTCQRLADGQTGEVWFQGPSVAAGYWGRAEETAETFGAKMTGEQEAGQWLRTGDLGVLTAAGLVVTGRQKEVIVVRGVNYDPADIERIAAESDPALAAGDGGAFPLETTRGESVALVHEVDRSAWKKLDANRVASNVVEAISRTFGLSLYDLVLLRPGTLPRTTSGKIQRHVCKSRYLGDGFADAIRVEHPGLGRCRERSGEFA